MQKYLLSVIWFIGKIWAFIYSYSLNTTLKRVGIRLYTAWISKEFKNLGHGSVINPDINLIGGKYISIGDKTIIGCRSALTAWNIYGTDKFIPSITIGSNVSIGEDSHITAINKIEIGNNVLTGKKVTISDNAHGKSDPLSLKIPPLQRKMYSDGPVIIEDGVWIGDKVSILSNVRIGENSIIGANAVVTKDIPANCVAVGIPARVIKVIL